MTSRLEVAIRKQLDGFTLDVEWSAGDGVAALFGPSGAGKTLTLQCLAGLVRPDAGRIVLGDDVLFDAAAGIDVAPQRRRVGYVFQGYALFPHLSVRGNVGFGLRGRARAGRRRREEEVLARLGLEPYAERYPRELSGGQRQRVALGRALATDPALLLLDEPLSACRCARPCATSWAPSSRTGASPRCWSPTTSPRPTASAIASWSTRRGG